MLREIAHWFIDKDRLGSKFYVLLQLFLLCYLFTIALNNRFQFTTNLITFAITAFFMMVIYPYNRRKPLVQAKREIRFLCWLVIIPTFLLSVFSLLTFLFQWSIVIDGYQMGFIENRLWGWCNPNTGSVVSMAAMLLGLVLLLCYSLTKRQRVFLYGNMFIQLSYIILSDSRGTMVSFLFLIFVLTALLLGHRMRKGGSLFSVARQKKLAILLFVPLLCVGATVGITRLSKAGYSYLPAVVALVGNAFTQEETMPMLPGETPKPATDIAVAPVEIGRDEPVRSQEARLVLWQYLYERILERPLFGMSYARVNYDIVHRFTWHNTHNVYFQLLVGNGLAGLGIMLIIAIYYLASMLRYFTKYRDDDKAYLINLLLFAFMLSLFVNGLFEARLVIGLSFRNAFFWFILSYQMYFVSHYEWKHGIVSFSERVATAARMVWLR
ncbi:O-antigen ligase family protein [Eubacteriales bacterium OttesenSCG-928-N14]|nr:O-antigen ligase family protein [Eubacteriales bacterium OttesenSCG-928-N14]